LSHGSQTTLRSERSPPPRAQLAESQAVAARVRAAARTAEKLGDLPEHKLHWDAKARRWKCSGPCKKSWKQKRDSKDAVCAPNGVANRAAQIARQEVKMAAAQQELRPDGRRRHFLQPYGEVRRNGTARVRRVRCAVCEQTWSGSRVASACPGHPPKARGGQGVVGAANACEAKELIEPKNPPRKRGQCPHGSGLEKGAELRGAVPEAHRGARSLDAEFGAVDLEEVARVGRGAARGAAGNREVPPEPRAAATVAGKRKPGIAKKVLPEQRPRQPAGRGGAAPRAPGSGGNHLADVRRRAKRR